MVAAVRGGQSLRSVARRFRNQLRTMQHWVARALDQRLNRVDWSDRPRGCRVAANRTASRVEDRVLATRKGLRERSALGEAGPQAIRDELCRQRLRKILSARTIARIMRRRGALDGQRRIRRPPPPRG